MSAVLLRASSVVLCFRFAELAPILKCLLCPHMPRWILTLDAKPGMSFCNITLRETKIYIDSQKAQSEARYGVDK